MRKSASPSGRRRISATCRIACCVSCSAGFWLAAPVVVPSVPLALSARAVGKATTLRGGISFSPSPSLELDSLRFTWDGESWEMAGFPGVSLGNSGRPWEADSAGSCDPSVSLVSSCEGGAGYLEGVILARLSDCHCPQRVRL